MLVIFHKQIFLDNEFRLLAVGSEEGRLSGVIGGDDVAS
jgi:hypothetical protein